MSKSDSTEKMLKSVKLEDAFKGTLNEDELESYRQIEQIEYNSGLNKKRTEFYSKYKQNELSKILWPEKFKDKLKNGGWFILITIVTWGIDKFLDYILTKY